MRGGGAQGGARDKDFSFLEKTLQEKQTNL